MRWLVLGLLVLIGGCQSMDIEQFKDRTPALKIEEFFLGRTEAWGIFEDRFGNLKRQFRVTIEGRLEQSAGRAELVLVEDFDYADGEQQQRIWRIELLGGGKYRGRADDVIGTAQGEASGNALNWSYRMALPIGDKTWQVDFNDWMWLQPGNVMINRAEVSKWGLTLGTVTLFFHKPPQRLSDQGSAGTLSLN